MKRCLALLAVACLAVMGYGGSAWALGLHLDKAEMAPGEEFTVYFTAPADYPRDAWVGVIPSNVKHGSESENDQYDLAYAYLEGKTKGSVRFTAPSEPGSYDIRMNSSDNNGKEVAFVTFTVGGGSAGLGTPLGGGYLTLEKTVFKPGETIKVNFQAPADWPESAWAGIIPADVPHGSETRNDEHDLAYQYLQKRTSGTLSFTAPAQKGKYDIRLHDTDGDGKEVDSLTFLVK